VHEYLPVPGDPLKQVYGDALQLPEQLAAKPKDETGGSGIDEVLSV
jgi:hypothetical protein